MSAQNGAQTLTRTSNCERRWRNNVGGAHERYDDIAAPRALENRAPMNYPKFSLRWNVWRRAESREKTRLTHRLARLCCWRKTSSGAQSGEGTVLVRWRLRTNRVVSSAYYQCWLVRVGKGSCLKNLVGDVLFLVPLLKTFTNTSVRTSGGPTIYGHDS